MHQDFDCKCHPIRRRRGMTLAIATLLSVVTFSAHAQTRSPDIKAKERRDPASGEVVIINRKKRKDTAPNPYAPIQSKPAQASKSARSAAPEKPLIRKNSAVARPRPIAPPPLPQANKERRAATARLRGLPQAAVADREKRALAVPERRPAIRPPPRRRQTVPRRRYSEQRRYRRRPWRQCRILARRCQAGYDGSCYIWQRRCT